MKELTSRERFLRMYEHREADRVPVIDHPWAATLERWQREGMPKDADYVDFFGLDRLGGVGVDNSPRYPVQTLEETEEYIVYKSGWGATLKQWKHQASTPEFLDFTIKDRDSWAAAKARMTVDPDRIPWDHLRKNYPTWRQQGRWIVGHLWFGFDVTHAWAVGTERVLFAMADDPDWCVDMFNTYLDLNLALMDMAWEAGFTFDEVNWPDDMGYKGKQFFSLNTYRELLKPVQKRAADWAHAKGCKVRLHSCGNVVPFIPEFVEIGIDALNPIEVKAGMDPLAIKQQFGDKLVLHGGINALLYNNPEALEAEIRRVVPALKQNGGYIFSSDHSVPSSISLEGFRRVVQLAKEVGRY